MTNDELSRVESYIRAGQPLPWGYARQLLEQLRSNAAEAVRTHKRLADAERKLEATMTERKSEAPGEVVPDVHPCEQAIRDLEAIERLRASPSLWELIDLCTTQRLRVSQYRWYCDEDKADAEGYVRMMDALLELLQPGGVSR